MILRDNVYGDIHEDAFRRDFTINALYYDPIDRTLVDYVGGLADLRARRLKLIGDPNVRFREDPVRILRAIRFATKLGFEIERETNDAIPGAAYMISAVAPARLFDELCKLLLQGHATGAWELLQRYELADTLFPGSQHLDAKPRPDPQRDGRNRPARSRRQAGHAGIPDRGVVVGFLPGAARATQRRDASGRSARIRERRSAARPERNRGDPASFRAVRSRSVVVPTAARNAARQWRRTSWSRIPAFARRTISCLLRASVGEVEQELADWWTNYQAADDEQRSSMSSAIAPRERQTQTPSAPSRRCLIHDRAVLHHGASPRPRALLNLPNGYADRRCRRG